MAEKTSKFKVDTEGGNRQKANQPGSRKGSREKRPSMISEFYTTGSGGRIRGSHGNIHSHQTNRSNFGANRAVSLDQYSTNNRRSSDGLQQVTSDNNVYYNQRQHRSLDNDMANAKILENALKLKTARDSSGDDKNNDTINKNVSGIDQPESKQQSLKNDTNKINSNTGSAINNGTKSFMSRLRQLTGRFSFSFDKDSKRGLVSTTQNSNAIRNNNLNESTLSKTTFCCSTKSNTKHDIIASTTTTGGITTNATTIATTVGPTATGAATTRNRAYSLDVPVRTRHSGSSNSGGGDSRKSSRNEDNHIMMLMMEDNNSNHTTVGDKSDGGDSGAGSYGGGGGGNSI